MNTVDSLTKDHLNKSKTAILEKKTNPSWKITLIS